MALILNIETSSSVCSVCLAQNGTLVDWRENTDHNSHARVLTVLIEDLASKNNLKLAQLDAVAVSAGPGSYTGLRIGTSVAKGLCYALNKPLIAVSTLKALAQGILAHNTSENALFMPVIDAGRQEIYTALYSSKGEEIWSPFPVIIDEQLDEKLSVFENIYIGGNATPKCKELLHAKNVKFIENIFFDSRYMINLAEELAHRQLFESTAYFEPHYLKAFQTKRPG
ncbi:MAG: tRNA (adenosine(37)-N6)-threonylcarbamoyltransferase complex dimerization subunit type 1 TsaB [Chitinophagales bacterium]